MRWWMIAVAGTIATPVTAEVVNVEPNGFETRATAIVAASPERVWQTLIAPAQWWRKEHSWSGDAANLSIDPRAGGCFCERLPPDGGVEHARVVFARPARMLRMRGALGPLQGEAVVGTLTIALKKADSGTEVTLGYVVGGYIRGGMATIAPAVDGVLAEQLAALKERAAIGS